jgi:hypothetical protein
MKLFSISFVCLLSWGVLCAAPASEQSVTFDPQNPDSFFQVDEPDPAAPVLPVKKGPKYSWLSKIAIRWGLAVAMAYESTVNKLTQWKAAIVALFSTPVSSPAGGPVLEQPACQGDLALPAQPLGTGGGDQVEVARS